MTRLIAACLAVALLAVLGFHLLKCDGGSAPAAIATHDQTQPAADITMSHADLDNLAQSPEFEYRRRLAALVPNDPEDVARLAHWTSQNNLRSQSLGLYERLLQLDSEHPAARRALGFVMLEGHWHDVHAALDIIAAKLDMANLDPAVETVLESIDNLDLPPSDRLRANELSAQLLLRTARFSDARDAYHHLAQTAPAPLAARLQTIAQILRDHPDGMYIVTEHYPPAALLLDISHRVEPGPASLAEPFVLDAALRDRARTLVHAGHRRLDEARFAEMREMEDAHKSYRLAMEDFDNADAIVPNIARSYKVETTRRRIAALRRSADANAALFDTELATLGRDTLSKHDYAEKLNRMSDLLHAVKTDLDDVLELAHQFDRELTMEIRWAEIDRERIETMLATLRQENHAR